MFLCMNCNNWHCFECVFRLLEYFVRVCQIKMVSSRMMDGDSLAPFSIKVITHEKMLSATKVHEQGYQPIYHVTCAMFDWYSAHFCLAESCKSILSA